MACMTCVFSLISVLTSCRPSPCPHVGDGYCFAPAALSSRKSAAPRQSLLTLHARASNSRGLHQREGCINLDTAPVLPLAPCGMASSPRHGCLCCLAVPFAVGWPSVAHVAELQPGTRRRF